jgi:hypothetical protein
VGIPLRRNDGNGHVRPAYGGVAGLALLITALTDKRVVALGQRTKDHRLLNAGILNSSPSSMPTKAELEQ